MRNLFRRIVRCSFCCTFM